MTAYEDLLWTAQHHSPSRRAACERYVSKLDPYTKLRAHLVAHGNDRTDTIIISLTVLGTGQTIHRANFHEQFTLLQRKLPCKFKGIGIEKLQFTISTNSRYDRWRGCMWHIANNPLDRSVSPRILCKPSS